MSEAANPLQSFELAAMSAAEHRYTKAMLLKRIEKEPEHAEVHLLRSLCFPKIEQIDAPKRESKIFKKIKGPHQGQRTSATGFSRADNSPSGAAKP
jgi:hypothetical protein